MSSKPPWNHKNSMKIKKTLKSEMTSIDEVLATPNIDNLNKIGESISILETHIVKLTQIRADYEDSGLYSISEVRFLPHGFSYLLIYTYYIYKNVIIISMISVKCHLETS